MARIATTTSAGVPTPLSGMTLDALMARQKALAERQGALAAPRSIQSPWQGAAQLAQSFFNARQEAGASDQLAQGRQQLAQVLAGVDPTTGATPAQLSQAYTLDPDLGVRLMESSAAAVRAARERQQHLADVADTRKFEVGQEQTIDTRELGQQQAATKAAQEFTTGQTTAAQEFQRKQQEDQQQAAIDAAALKANDPTTPQGKIVSDFKAGAYGDPATPEAAALRDAAMKKANAIPTPAGVNADRKALWGQQDEYINTASSVGKLKRASDLLKQGINTGYTAGLRTMYGKAGGPGGDAEAAKRTNEYNAIMTGEAITAMSQSLKGATTDTEMARFIEIMNDPTIDPSIKQTQLDTMLAKAQSFNELQGSRIKELGGDIPSGPADTSGGGAAGEAMLLQAARDAIAKGADPALVRKRLVDKGFDPGKL